MPDLERVIRWASLDMKRFCCWCWKVARLAASEAAAIETGEAGEAGVEAGLGTELSFAKQMRHFPANRGLWSGSRSRPHSKHNKLSPGGGWWEEGRRPLQMLERSSIWCTREWCWSNSMVMNVLLQTPQVSPVSPGKQTIYEKESFW